MSRDGSWMLYPVQHTPMYTQLCNSSGVEAVDNQAHSAASTRKSAEFLAVSQLLFPRHQFRGLHFFGTLLSGSVQQAQGSSHRYSSDTRLCWLQSATKFTLDNMAFGNGAREQPVASCHQAAINTVKNLLRSYSQVLRDHLLLIKYYEVLKGI